MTPLNVSGYPSMARLNLASRSWALPFMQNIPPLKFFGLRTISKTVRVRVFGAKVNLRLNRYSMLSRGAS
jgi:hypothetical protein